MNRSWYPRTTSILVCCNITSETHTPYGSYAARHGNGRWCLRNQFSVREASRRADKTACIVCFASSPEAPNDMEDQAQAKQPETEQGKYVYCIIKTDIPRDFGPVGIGGRGDKVHTVPYK